MTSNNVLAHTSNKEKINENTYNTHITFIASTAPYLLYGIVKRFLCESFESNVISLRFLLLIFPFTLSSNSFFIQPHCVSKTQNVKAQFLKCREKKSITKLRQPTKTEERKNTTIRILCNGIPFASLTERFLVVSILPVYLWFFVFHYSFCSYLFALFRLSPFYFRFSFILSSYLAYTPMCASIHTFPIHLIKIRQNEKCDKSIYSMVILDIALLRCDTQRAVLDATNHICDAWANAHNIYMCVRVCEACHTFWYFI